MPMERRKGGVCGAVGCASVFAFDSADSNERLRHERRVVVQAASERSATTEIRDRCETRRNFEQRKRGCDVWVEAMDEYERERVDDHEALEVVSRRTIRRQPSEQQNLLFRSWCRRKDCRRTFEEERHCLREPSGLHVRGRRERRNTQALLVARESERERVSEHLLHPTLSIEPFVLLLIRCPHGTVLLDMVTSTWQLEWKVRGTLRGRMVLPEVQHWELLESFGMQTLCGCHERQCGSAADLDPGEDCSPGRRLLVWATTSLF